MRFAQGEGYLQVATTTCSCSSRRRSSPDELDAADLQERLRKAEEAAEQAEDGTEEQRRAARDKRRWEAFLDIAGELAASRRVQAGRPAAASRAAAGRSAPRRARSSPAMAFAARLPSRPP